MSQKIQDIKIIKKEVIIERANNSRRIEINMLKLLLEKYFPEKVEIIFPPKKLGAW